MSAIMHHLITALFIYTTAGSLVWMMIYAHGYLVRVYYEPSGMGAVIDGFANILITLTLILGWPGMLGVVLHSARQRRARR